MGALACLIIIVASFVYAPWVNDGPVLCPLRFVFGFPCPGCGLTRSFCAMAQGHFVKALSFHLFGPFLFISLVLAIPLLTVEAARRRRFVFIHRILFLRNAGYVVGGSLILYHSVRLISLAISGQLILSVKESVVGVFLKYIVGWFV
ncbi:DUF2752 domain-containing protein [Candidatus Poribacteria bacterium]|nr:DUF2752 domain-containing protein [Candidatus Poribacteria bacterium]